MQRHWKPCASLVRITNGAVIFGFWSCGQASHVELSHDRKAHSWVQAPNSEEQGLSTCLPALPVALLSPATAWRLSPSVDDQTMVLEPFSPVQRSAVSRRGVKCCVCCSTAALRTLPYVEQASLSSTEPGVAKLRENKCTAVTVQVGMQNGGGAPC